ncbi:MAG: hypothetical protein CMJ34_07030 [Phycisphaerae bacterium]|nr:hypothetical protein [Phycisphaerae bacterium]
MRMPLTIAGLPELESLTSDQRRELLAACKAPSALRLWTSNLARGMCLAAVLFFILHLGNGARQITGPIGVGILLIGISGMTLVMHLWTITRIRGQIRMAIEAASIGGLVPICTRCGHDCTRITATRCPECGASRRIPSPATETTP